MAFVIPAVMAAASAIGSAGAAAAGGAGLAGTFAGAALPSLAVTTAASAPGWLAAAGTASSLLGGITGGIGAIQSSQAQAGAANYNAAIEKQNAALSRENAAIAGQAGAEQGWQVGQKTRSAVGAMRANQAAAGVDVMSGSAVDVRSSAAELGELDALTVRSNATREAYGYTQQAVSHEQQSALDTFSAKNAQTAGLIGGASTFLGGVGSAADNFAKYQLAGGFGG